MDALLQGLVLLVAGMGTVYLFLAILVWVMNRAATIVPRFNHILPDREPRKRAKQPSANLPQTESEAPLIAIALAALAAHTGVTTDDDQGIAVALAALAARTGLTTDDDRIAVALAAVAAHTR